MFILITPASIEVLMSCAGRERRREKRTSPRRVLMRRFVYSRSSHGMYACPRADYPWQCPSVQSDGKYGGNVKERAEAGAKNRKAGWRAAAAEEKFAKANAWESGNDGRSQTAE
eukprot:4476776-Pleurochrysis_carterae.AAC.1